MAATLLHLTHTDIRSDSRILKELRALDVFSDFRLIAIGLQRDDGSSSGVTELNATVHTLRLVTRIFGFFPRSIRYFLSLLELTLVFTVRGLILRPTLVHCHDTFVLPAGWLIKLFSGCKLVYDAHELESNKNGQTALLSKTTLLIEKACWRKVDLLVSVSQSIISWYVENLGSKEHALVLNSPVLDSSSHKISKSKEDKGYFHQLYDIAGEKPVFIYVGILSEGRGIEMCLDAFADSTPPDAHLIFLGYGRLSSLIEAYSERHGNIHLHPSVPHEQVVPLVQNADVGLCFIGNVSLSDYYCLPNKLFEYCFAGVPVLASNFPEIREVVEEYGLGMCCEPESKAVKEAIQKVIDNPLPAIASDMTELSWSAQAERLQQAYRLLLNVD